ncbi:MAG: T6SS immunity protein Tli4 family protein [Telluria sp.]|nr:T6SS immunity protein Tli4 family protein [Telluria sp.]
MTPKVSNKPVQDLLAAVLALALLEACSPTYSYKENAVPEPVSLSPRLQTMFAKTKLVCFGRYALEVPQEAQLLPGSISIPAHVEIIAGGMEASKFRVAADIAKIKRGDKTAEITFNGKGPIERSWQLRYSEDEDARIEGLYFFTTYVNMGDLTYIFGDSIDAGETEEAPAARQAALAKSLRLRYGEEVPEEPGFCLKHGFIASKLYASQEMSNAGIYLPSLPDVTFSVSSNKDAYGDYPPAEFEKTQRAKLSLLARIEQAKKNQGSFYPSRNVLREGKRDVHHWHGEESLFKRADGVHDFEWALVGTPRDVANPSEFSAHMYTKVEHDTVGAAHAASLSDDEAVALWDKLLSGLKFRVKVPGAPEGSYFIDLKKTDEHK